MTYPRYEKYKEDNTSWLNAYPYEWKLKRLKFCVSLINNKKNYHMLDAPYLGLEHIESWTGKRLNDKSATSDGVVCQFKPGDVLFGKLRPYLAKVYLAKEDGCASTEILILRPNQYVTPEYLQYFMLMPEFINIINASTYGAKMPRANWEFIGNQSICIPTIPQQKIITGFLEYKIAEMDALISKKQALIKLLAEKRIALITQTVTKGLNPNITMKDSMINWLGAMPENWDVGKISYYYEVQLGKMLQPEPRNTNDILKEYLRAANLAWSGVDLSDVKEMWFNQREMTKYRLRQDDVLVSEGGDVGRTSFWNKDEEMYIQNAINRVRSWNSKKNHSRFIYYWFYYLKTRGLINVICNTSTISHYTAEKVKATPFLIPPLSEQKDIASFLDTKTAEMDAICTKIVGAIDHLKEYRAALITNVVLGKINISGLLQECSSESRKERVL